MIQIESTAPVGGAAKHLAVADGGRGTIDVHPAADIRCRPRPAAQPGRVAASDAQSLDRGADSAGDVQHPPLPPRVQDGGVGIGVVGRPMGDGVAAPDSHRLAEVDHLSHACAGADIGVRASGHADFVAVVGRVHGGLKGGITGASTAAVPKGGHVMNRPLGVGCLWQRIVQPFGLAQGKQPHQGQDQAPAQCQCDDCTNWEAFHSNLLWSLANWGFPISSVHRSPAEAGQSGKARSAVAYDEGQVDALERSRRPVFIGTQVRGLIGARLVVHICPHPRIHIPIHRR